MFWERRVVDNRVFLLGLDYLYRDAMRRHERTDLLTCARRVAAALQLPPADVPVEGYYAEEEPLAEYFRLVRALQECDGSAASAVDRLPEFQRMKEVTAAPLYGRPQFKGRLLPTGRDALSQALLDTFPDWSVAGLTEAACRAAREMDDISLVGLAALARDTVVLAAVRESVVLYAEAVIGAALHPPRPKYVWEVDDELARQAGRFIDAFNALFGDELPSPDPRHAEAFWRACEDTEILGRCVRLGVDDSVSPMRHYHWAICRGSDGEPAVRDLWKSEVWTTTRYRSTLWGGGRCPEL